jgi:hypothetical protein
VLQACYIGRIEIGTATEADKLTPEQLNVRIKGDDRLVAANCHDVHGFTPFSSNHLRMAATAPLSASGDIRNNE